MSDDLDEIEPDELPDPALHELADAVETEADADAGDGDHDHDHGHDHDTHDDHDAHPAEDPRWVLLPLVVGLVIGALLLLAFGLASGAASLA